jgi:hypothetical protein
VQTDPAHASREGADPAATDSITRLYAAAGLAVDGTIGVREACEELGRRRAAQTGRGFFLVPYPFPPELVGGGQLRGLYAATGSADFVFFDASLTGRARDAVIAEFACAMLDAGADPAPRCLSRLFQDSPIGSAAARRLLLAEPATSQAPV